VADYYETTENNFIVSHLKFVTQILGKIRKYSIKTDTLLSKTHI